MAATQPVVLEEKCVVEASQTKEVEALAETYLDKLHTDQSESYIRKVISENPSLASFKKAGLKSKILREFVKIQIVKDIDNSNPIKLLNSEDSNRIRPPLEELR
jgi:hypothetical protein